MKKIKPVIDPDMFDEMKKELDIADKMKKEFDMLNETKKELDISYENEKKTTTVKTRSGKSLELLVNLFDDIYDNEDEDE